MQTDPSLDNLINPTSEEYYENMLGYTGEIEYNEFEEDCPDWVMEQIDEELEDNFF